MNKNPNGLLRFFFTERRRTDCCFFHIYSGSQKYHCTRRIVTRWQSVDKQLQIPLPKRSFVNTMNSQQTWQSSYLLENSLNWWTGFASSASVCYDLRVKFLSWKNYRKVTGVPHLKPFQVDCFIRPTILISPLSTIQGTVLQVVKRECNSPI